MRGALEGFEARQTDEVIAGPVIGFAVPFPDISAAAGHEAINRRVALIGIANLHFAQRQNAVGQVFALSTLNTVYSRIMGTMRVSPSSPSWSATCSCFTK